MAGNPVAAQNPQILPNSNYGQVAPGASTRPLDTASKASSTISRLAAAVARVQGTKRSKNSIDLFMP